MLFRSRQGLFRTGRRSVRSRAHAAAAHSIQTVHASAARRQRVRQSTSVAEVTHISTQGFGVLLGDEELFIPFAQFPWFRNATMGVLSRMEWPSADHLYWPDLDIDLSVESVRHPERFPLMSRQDA